MSIEDAGKASGERNVRVEMFSAERRKAAGPFEGMTGNPVLSLFLEPPDMAIPCCSPQCTYKTPMPPPSVPRLATPPELT